MLFNTKFVALLLTACGSDTSAATMHLMRAEGQVNVSNAAGTEVALLDNSDKSDSDGQ